MIALYIYICIVYKKIFLFRIIIIDLRVWLTSGTFLIEIFFCIN